MRESCVGCKHLRLLDGGSWASEAVCHYLLDTGEKRNCPAAECIHHTGKKKPEKEDEKNVR